MSEIPQTAIDAGREAARRVAAGSYTWDLIADEVLEAAAPHVAAVAWRDGYGQGRDDEASDLPLRDYGTIGPLNAAVVHAVGEEDDQPLCFTTDAHYEANGDVPITISHNPTKVTCTVCLRLLDGEPA